MREKLKSHHLSMSNSPPERDDLLIAGTDGYLFIEINSVKVKPFFRLEDITNEYEAYIEVMKPLRKNDFNGEDLLRFLSDCGIVYGILEEEVEKIFKQKKYERRILVACGKKVVDGKDGAIKYYFSSIVKHRIDEEGKADYKEIDLIKNVKAGDKLAQIIPPEEGEEGCTIFGKKIPPKEGGEIPHLPAGQNVQPDPDNPNVLLAEIDGHVRLKGDKVEVTPLFTVQNDVDFSTGNIVFIGSVLVKGDVKSGFQVTAKNDIQVNGVVEDAVVESGGSVLLKGGFIGKNNGTLIAQEEVMALFCENETITCGGDIYIKDYVMNSNIRTGGKLVVKGKHGLIVGGEIYTVKGIEANVVGNDRHAPTNLIVAADETDKSVILQRLTDNWKLADQEIIRLNTFLEGLERQKLLKKELTKDQKDLLQKLSELKTKKENLTKHLMSQIKILDTKISALKDAVVKISDTVYPKTNITIYDKSITVDECWKYVYFKYMSNQEELVAVDLEMVK